MPRPVTRNRRIFPAAAILVLAAAAGIATAGDFAYIVEDLGELVPGGSGMAYAINSHGDVVGRSGSKAFLYTDATGMIEIPAPPGLPNSRAYAINDHGHVAGTAWGDFNTERAWIWKGGLTTNLGTLGSWISEARGIGHDDTVVGFSYPPGGMTPAAIHCPQGADMQLLPGFGAYGAVSYVVAMNKSGIIIGYENNVAFQWTAATGKQLLAKASGHAYSYAHAINDNGMIAGYVKTQTGNSTSFARWLPDGQVQTLGGAGSGNVLYGLNNHGVAVGVGKWCTSPLECAVIYTEEGGIQSLNSFIDPSLNIWIVEARAINDAGQIVGQALNNNTGQWRPVRLTPKASDPDPPPPVIGDLNGDGVVGVADLLILLAAWGECPPAAPCPADLNGDGTVGVADLLVLLSNWG